MAVLVAAGGAVLATAKGWPVEPVVVGLTAGWIMTPDLDVDHETIEEYRLSRVPLLGFALATGWQMLWLPYARAIPHRSPISHWPIIGTLFRAAYLTLWLLALALLMGWCGGERNGVAPFDWLCIWHYLWPWGLMAWAVQDLGHAAFDYLPILRRM